MALWNWFIIKTPIKAAKLRSLIDICFLSNISLTLIHKVDVFARLRPICSRVIEVNPELFVWFIRSFHELAVSMLETINIFTVKKSWSVPFCNQRFHCQFICWYPFTQIVFQFIIENIFNSILGYCLEIFLLKSSRNFYFIWT